MKLSDGWGGGGGGTKYNSLDLQVDIYLLQGR